jgi:ribosomal protein L29
MKPLKISDLREKSVEDLEQMLNQAHADLFTVRRDLVFRRTTDLAGRKTRRHDIARIKTIITEKQKGAKA